MSAVTLTSTENSLPFRLRIYYRRVRGSFLLCTPFCHAQKCNEVDCSACMPKCPW